MLSFQLSNELKEKLKITAKEKEISVSALVRLIIKEYFNDNDI